MSMSLHLQTDNIHFKIYLKHFFFFEHDFVVFGFYNEKKIFKSEKNLMSSTASSDWVGLYSNTFIFRQKRPANDDIITQEFSILCS